MPKEQNDAAFLSLILENLPTGIFVTDSNSIVRYINKAYADFLGFPRQQIIGRPITDFIPDSRAPHVTSTGTAEMGHLCRIKGKSGERVAVVNRLPLTDGGNFVGMISQTLFGSREEYQAVVRRIEDLDKQVADYRRRMKSTFSPRYSLDSIIGGSRAIVDFRDQIVSFARTELAVLLTGATGTGKELAANAIHCESTRRDGPFVSINCAAIPRELFESEFFGYAPGAFSDAHKDGKVGLIELADKGTLFLDEIGEMPLSAQAKLLRVLEDRMLMRLGSGWPRMVDFRLVAATNRSLMEMIDQKLFREDLYYRISTLTLHSPCLSERREDIPLLVKHFLTRMGRREVAVTPEAMRLLCDHDWKGNIRELSNVVARALGLAKDTVIDGALLPHDLARREDGGLPGAAQTAAVAGTGVTLAGNERRMIIETLRELDGNVAGTARKLGIARATLYEKMKRYGIDKKNFNHTCWSGAAADD